MHCRSVLLLSRLDASARSVDHIADAVLPNFVAFDGDLKTVPFVSRYEGQTTQQTGSANGNNVDGWCPSLA